MVTTKKIILTRGIRKYDKIKIKQKKLNKRKNSSTSNYMLVRAIYELCFDFFS